MTQCGIVRVGQTMGQRRKGRRRSTREKEPWKAKKGNVAKTRERDQTEVVNASQERRIDDGGMRESVDGMGQDTNENGTVRVV